VVQADPGSPGQRAVKRVCVQVSRFAAERWRLQQISIRSACSQCCNKKEISKVKILTPEIKIEIKILTHQDQDSNFRARTFELEMVNGMQLKNRSVLNHSFCTPQVYGTTVRCYIALQYVQSHSVPTVHYSPLRQALF